ncbi:MAG: succinate dehydrogenase assembly factor 2 [Alphaproteobacteria bacterium HGW-Alphaproteobacteria-11]|nr:MAG: succinate dehydrogenase assembly factor 2 [Alphaproteobacteria bacterium HGW-Alphaproteobacteria-11]
MAETSAEEHCARLRRIGFRSWHRGIREMDLILGHFSDNMLESLSFTELDQYEALLEAEDTSLYSWITGRERAPAEHDTPLLARIRTFNHMKGTLWANRSEG